MAVVPAVPQPQRKRMLRPRLTVAQVVFAGPPILAFLIFRYIPVLSGLRMSLVSWTPTDASQRFVGLQNYADAISSPLFWQFLGNTAVLFLLALVFGFWVPIVQALLLSQIRFLHRPIRYLFVLPAALPVTTGWVIWKYIWDPAYGYANGILSWFGIPAQGWLGDPAMVKTTLMLPGLLGGGFGILIYLATIQNVSEEMIEAAIVDGASAWQRLWKIILPNIANMIQIQFILALSSALLMFDYPFFMTKGGPGYESTTIVMGVYNKAFSEFRYSEAQAWAFLITIISIIVTAISLKMSREEPN